MNLIELNLLLTHEDFIIRETALQIADKKQSFSPESTQQIIKAIEKYGPTDSYSNTHWLSGAPLDDDSALWLLDFIEAHSSSFKGSQSYHFSKWFLNQAPLTFLEKHSDRYTKTLAKLLNTNPTELISKLGRKLDASQLTSKELYTKILRSLNPVINPVTPEDDIQDLDTVSHFQYSPELIDLMGDDIATLEDNVLEGLSQIPHDETPEHIVDLNSMLISLAGKMKLEKVVPYLLQHMDLDWEIFNEIVPEALAQIGTQSTLEQTAHFYRRYQDNNSSWIPNFLSSTFEKCQHPLAPKIALDLLADEDDVVRRNNLIGALCYGMEEDHLVFVIKEWREFQDDPDFNFFMNFFYTHAKITDRKYPEIDHWISQLKIEKKKMESLNFGLEGQSQLDKIHKLMTEHIKSISPNHSWMEEKQIYQRAEEKISRNAPCPCGSGKKYKRCCMNK